MNDAHERMRILRHEVNSLRDDNLELKASLDEALSLLRQLEWLNLAQINKAHVGRSCAVCEGGLPFGHVSVCRLDDFLSRHPL